MSFAPPGSFLTACALQDITACFYFYGSNKVVGDLHAALLPSLADVQKMVGYGHVYRFSQQENALVIGSYCDSAALPLCVEARPWPHGRICLQSRFPHREPHPDIWPSDLRRPAYGCAAVCCVWSALLARCRTLNSRCMLVSHLGCRRLCGSWSQLLS